MFLVFFPFTLALALALHFTLKQRFRRPSACLGLLLGGQTAAVFCVDF
jgi:hypothetical protein